MADNSNILCPIYLVTESATGTVPTITDKEEQWFPVYCSRELAEKAVAQHGADYSFRSMNDTDELQVLLENNPQVAGILVQNPAATNLWSPVPRQQLLGGGA